MALDFNEIVLAGNVGREPELRTTQSGQSVCNFSVGETERYRQDDDWKSRTQWWRIVVWGQQAERLSDTLNKGDVVIVVGRVKVGAYEKNGLEIPTIEVNAKMVRSMPKRDEKPKRGFEPPPQQDDIPF